MRDPGVGQPRVPVWAVAAALPLLLLAVAAGASAGGEAEATSGGMPGGMVTVFAAECNDYMTWQSIAVVYTHCKMGVPGPIIRILTCDEQALRDYADDVNVVPTHVSPSWTYDKNNNDAYLAYNKPGALIDWLEKAPPKEEWVLVMDPDMIIRDTFNEWGRVYGADRGWAVSLYFGYMQGVANNLSATHVPEIEPRADTLAGPRGRRGDMASGVVLMHRDDLQRVGRLWLHYSEAVRDDPLGYKETGDEYAKRPGQKPWIAEMYGYSFGAAKAGVWHRVDYNAQLYPGYQAFDKPLILHYGRLWELAPPIGPAWRYQKHWFRTFKATQCPPWPHIGMELTGQDVAPKVTGGLFPPPPHPSEFAHLPPPQRYKELLSIQVIATVNAALCERHLAKCPPSQELTVQCDKVKQLEREVDDAIQEVEGGPGICTDRKPPNECRNWAARKLCWQDPGFMHNWCRETCGLCRLPAGRRQVAWNESLDAAGGNRGWRQKQRGGRKEQLPHWTEALRTAEVHRMHADQAHAEEEARSSSASASVILAGVGGGSGGGGRTVLGLGGSQGGGLMYAAVAGWVLALGLLGGWALRGWLRYRQRSGAASIGRLPVGKLGRPRASTALVG